MTILLVLIPLGIVLLGLAIALFVWAVRHGQFEDLEGEGARILFDDPPIGAPAAAASLRSSSVPIALPAPPSKALAPRRPGRGEV